MHVKGKYRITVWNMFMDNVVLRLNALIFLSHERVAIHSAVICSQSWWITPNVCELFWYQTKSGDSLSGLVWMCLFVISSIVPKGDGCIYGQCQTIWIRLSIQWANKIHILQIYIRKNQFVIGRINYRQPNQNLQKRFVENILNDFKIIRLFFRLWSVAFIVK